PVFESAHESGAALGVGLAAGVLRAALVRLSLARAAERPVHAADHEAESDDAEGDPPRRVRHQRDREDRRGQPGQCDEDAEDEALGGEARYRGCGLGLGDIARETRVFTAQLLLELIQQLLFVIGEWHLEPPLPYSGL